MQKNTRLKPILFAPTLVAVVFMLSFCASAPPAETGQMVRIAEFQDEKQLNRLYGKHRVPLVVIGKAVYLPSSPCLPVRITGGDTEQRHLAGDTESRRLGGDTLSIQCVILDDESGFKVLNLRSGTTVRFYDSSGMHVAVNHIIILH